MSESRAQPSSRFWDFTLSVYKKDGVAMACIALQDRRRLDVNLLLLCLFAGANGRALREDELAGIDAAIAPWRQHVIHPLRGVRRWLKEQTLLPKELADAVRRGVLGQEIESEGVQQRLMEARLAIPAGAPDPHVAGANLARYFAVAGVAADDADGDALATLLSQAFPPCDLQQAKAILRDGFR
ncbi:MAG: TIGR02444 family protein [Proteobacteria bacterium]|nr:TIGR02444 family protein [Pseudomonadota bacterium]